MLSEKAANRERSDKQVPAHLPSYTGCKVAGAGWELEQQVKYFLFWETQDNLDNFRSGF